MKENKLAESAKNITKERDYQDDLAYLRRTKLTSWSRLKSYPGIDLQLVILVCNALEGWFSVG